MAAAVLNNKIFAAGGSGGGPGGTGGPPGGNPNGPSPSIQPGNQGIPPQGNKPPARPEQNHPVDLELFILK